MARYIVVMIGAIIFAIIGMMTFAGIVSVFIDSHPTIKILALSFLILIGVLLVAEGFGKEIERGYVYRTVAGRPYPFKGRDESGGQVC